SESPTVKTKESAINSAYCSDLSTLDFNEFSLLNDDRSIPSLGDRCHDLLFEYLREYFGLGIDNPLPTLTPSSSRGETEIDKILKPETLLIVLIQYFPEAVAISFIFNTIIVKFDEVDKDIYRERESDPYYIPSRISPPKLVDLKTFILDDSDYIATIGSFNPRRRVLSRGLPLRITVRIGSSTKEYIDETDIGLTKLDNTITFSNRFLDIETVAKALILFIGVKIEAKFFINSFVTGRQCLLYTGDFLRDRRENPPDGKYIIIYQGIYATNNTRIGEESICLEDREVCGIIYWADLAMKYSTSSKFFCFTDPIDPLISNGWACVPVPEKRPYSSS
ncbi:hypothetical protein N7501_007727, partial [Penicillium viridicatum]